MTVHVGRLDTKSSVLSRLLGLVCEQLQLTDTQYDAATSAYMSVGRWLAAEESPLAMYRPDVSPQGSVAIGTTVKPRESEEFDVDLVLLLHRDPNHVLPNVVFDEVVKRMKAHATYAPMLDVQERCLVLNYAGQFCLDILPACPNPVVGGTALLIPDREQKMWIPTNPRGYINWFADKALNTVMEKRAQLSVRPLPPNVEAEDKTALQRMVQLFKRRRDVHFEGSLASPRSIVLTTLCGETYSGSIDVADAIDSSLGTILSRAQMSKVVPIVPNPSVHGENLAADWQDDSRLYQHFLNFVMTFQSDMRKLREDQSAEKIAQRLSEMFDPRDTGIVKRAFETYTGQYAAARGTGIIRMSKTSTTLTTAASSIPSISIPKNTFYGS